MTIVMFMVGLIIGLLLGHFLEFHRWASKAVDGTRMAGFRKLYYVTEDCGHADTD